MKAAKLTNLAKPLAALEAFANALGALRVARSAIQMLALAISKHEEILRKQTDGIIGTLIVHDHHWIRGEDEEF